MPIPKCTLSRLRRLTNQSTSASRIALHRLLREVERSPGLWTSEYGSFANFLGTENFAYGPTHRAFCAAEDLLGASRIDRLGFWASLRLGNIEDAVLRGQVLRAIRPWIDARTFPPYQAVTGWLRENFPADFVTTPRRSYTEVVRERELLRDALNDANQELRSMRERLQAMAVRLHGTNRELHDTTERLHAVEAVLDDMHTSCAAE